jgi:hypothetical protein
MKIKLMLILVALAGLASLGMARVQDHQNHSSQMDMPMMQDCLMHANDVEITVQDTADGVSITLRPKDPAKLEELRTAVKKHLLMKDMMKGRMPQNR